MQLLALLVGKDMLEVHNCLVQGLLRAGLHWSGKGRWTKLSSISASCEPQ